MNSTIETLLAHRSIRKFTDQPLAPELLLGLIEAGQFASTSSFIQATSVVNVVDQEKRQQFSELSGDQKYVATAPAFLVFCADLQRNKVRVSSLGGKSDYSWTEQFISATVDTALFAQNVVIAAESQNLGICYIGGIRNDPEQVSELLSLPELVFPVFGLCVGYPDQQPERKPRLPVQSVLHHDSYDQQLNCDQRIDDYDNLVSDYYQRRSKGKFSFSWSEQIKKQSETQSRPFMRDYLQKIGFIQK